jgi:hypothetical protein
VETILLLNNLDGSGGDQIYLPTSLELTMYLSDPAPPAQNVPAPLAAPWGRGRLGLKPSAAAPLPGQQLWGCQPGAVGEGRKPPRWPHLLWKSPQT